MTEEEERFYLQGERMAWRQMLAVCVKELGYDSVETQQVRWIKEREDTIALLRQLCEYYGDNEWNESIYLADVIGKHLGQLDL